MGTRRFVAAVAAAATLGGCSGGDGDGGTQLTPTIEIALSQAALSIVQGASNTVNVTLSRGGGFAGPVDITVENVPTGATATAAPTTIAAGSTSSVITITPGATTAAGSYNLTVRAKGTGVTDKTQTLALTVTAAPAGSFTLALNPTTVSVQQGGTGASNVTITRANFAGAVTLALEGAPAGVTGAFAPNNTTANASELTVTVPAAVAAGTYTLTVRGTATGPAAQTAALTLTVTAAPVVGYSIAVTPATTTINQGASGNVNVALTRTGGFAGAVTLALEGAPAGVTGTFAPNNTTTSASVLTLNVGAAVTPGNHTLTVKGTADGQTEKTTTFTLTVPAPAGNFTLSLNPATVNVQQGANGTTTVNINRTGGFAGAVNLTLTGTLPTGLTAAFNPASTTDNTSTLTLTAAQGTAVGQYPLTVRGNFTGLTEQTATLTVNVTQATGGSGNTTYDFCRAEDMPLWFAAQDGTGAWTRVTPTGTRFIFNIASGRGGIAWVEGGVTSPSGSRSFARRISGALEDALVVRNRMTAAHGRTASRARAFALADAFDLTILYGTQAELNTQGGCPPGATVGKTVTGSVDGVGATQTAYVSLGPVTEAVTPAQGTSFTLTEVPDGNLDLLAARVTSTISGTGISFATDKIIIRRNQNPANNAVLPVLDFNTQGFAPAQANLTVGNLGTDVALVSTSFFTAGASDATLFSGFGTGTGPFPYYGIPLAEQQASDLHLALILAAPDTDTPTSFRATATYFKDPTNRTINLGPQFNTPTVTVAGTTPYVRLRAQGTLNTEYNKYLSIVYTQGTTEARSVTIGASAGYLTGSAYDLTIPDFSGVAGWDNAWGLRTGSEVEWTVAGIGFTGLGIADPTPSEGTAFMQAARFGTLTP